MLLSKPTMHYSYEFYLKYNELTQNYWHLTDRYADVARDYPWFFQLAQDFQDLAVFVVWAWYRRPCHNKTYLFERLVTFFCIGDRMLVVFQMMWPFWRTFSRSQYAFASYADDTPQWPHKEAEKGFYLYSINWRLIRWMETLNKV